MRRARQAPQPAAGKGAAGSRRPAQKGAARCFKNSVTFVDHALLPLFSLSLWPACLLAHLSTAATRRPRRPRRLPPRGEQVECNAGALFSTFVVRKYGRFDEATAAGACLHTAFPFRLFHSQSDSFVQVTQTRGKNSHREACAALASIPKKWRCPRPSPRLRRPLLWRLVLPTPPASSRLAALSCTLTASRVPCSLPQLNAPAPVL